MPRCNYDEWNTKTPKSLNQATLSVLRGMKDGKTRARCDMIRRGRPPTDPNPRSEFGFAGWNKIDYNLYRMGLLVFVREWGGTKHFRISANGKRLLAEAKNQTSHKLTEAQLKWARPTLEHIWDDE